MDFIKLDEIIVSFIDDSLYYFLIFGGAFIPFFLSPTPYEETKSNVEEKKIGKAEKLEQGLAKIEEEIIEADKKITEIEKKIEEIENTKKYIRRTNRFIFFTMILFCSLFVISLFLPMRNYDRVSLFMISGYSVILYFEKQVSKFFKEDSYYVAVSLAILLYVICGSYKDAFKIEEKVNLNKVEIIFQDDKIIKTDSFYHYLGKTENYLFFFDSKIQKTDVISNDNFLKMEIIKNKK